jgi:hypothetical protein
VINKTYLLQECPHNYKCDWVLEKSPIKCTTSSSIGKAYPGVYCESNSDCILGNCNSTKCVAKNAGESCNKSECDFGLYCEGNCTALKFENMTCFSDSECNRNLGCFQGSCRKYFSFEDNTNVFNEKNNFLCKSGYSVDNICHTISNYKYDSVTGCDPKYPCNYTDSFGKLHSLNSCECAFSKISQANCKLAPANNTYFTKYIENIRSIISDSYSKNCNADEPRFQYCREYQRNDWNIKKKIIEFKKNEIYSLNFNSLKEADSCVSKVVFGFDDTPPQPRNNKWSCPIYTCDTNNLTSSSCAFSNNPFNEDGTNVTVYLKNTCQSDESCSFNQSQIFSNWTTYSRCSKNNLPDTKRNKYPGEKCHSHHECINSEFNKTIGFCINGKCSGLSENDRCDSNSDCIVGYFCNGLWCQAQQNENGFCINDYDCQNHLGCLNNNCIKLLSLTNGTYLYNDNSMEKFCEFGLINNETNQCAQTTYKNSTPDSDGFVKCDLGDNCYYTTGFLDKNGDNFTITKPCECGYNDQGHGYCPLPHSYRKFKF